MTNKILNQLFSSCKKWKTLVLISMLLTLGVGQMWANSAYKFNNGQYIYFKIAGGNTNWTQATYVPKFNWYWDSGTYNTDALGTAVPGTSSAYYYAIVPNAYTGYIQICRMNASNTGQQWNYSSNFEATSDRTKNCLYSGSACWDGCSLSITTYAPPAKSVALSYNVVPSSGAGTEGNPYIVPTGTTVRVTAAGTSELDDPDITKKYKWDSGSYGTTAYKDLVCSTHNTVYSTTVSYKNYISSTASTNDKSATVYFKAVSSPSLVLNSVSPTALISGNDVTITTTRSFTTNTITFEYTTNNGSTWSSLTPKSTSNSGQTAVWTIPEAHGETQTYKFRAKITADGLTTSASDAVSAYGTKTIHVKNTNSWSTLYVYAWDGSGDITKSWPGNTGNDNNGGFSCTNVGGGLWWDVVITSRATNFIINQNVTGDANQTADLSYSTYTNGSCYAIGTNSGKRTLSSTTVSCLGNASVTTTAAASILRTSATLGGNVTGNGNDKIISYGYYYTTNSALSASNVIGTRVEVGTDNKSGSYTKSQTGLTANTTYYVMAYAKNGNGEAYGSVQSFTTLAQYTVTTGVVDGQTARGSVSPASVTCSSAEWSANVTASANPGYSFNSWTTSDGITKAGATSPTQVKATKAGTIKASFNEVMRTVSVVSNNTNFGNVSTASLTSVGPETKSAEVTATPETGATFTRWDVESGLTIASDYTSTSNPVKVNATAASKTLTAVFTETKYTVSMSTADGNKGTVGAASASVGQITAVEITATPKSGYMFSKWVKTGGSGTVTYYTGPGNGQVTDASGEEKETTYICVTGNVTLQATWEADRSSGYVVYYGNDGKNADGGTDMSQKRAWKDGKLYRPTTAASDISYFTFTAGVGDVDKVIEFKVHKLSPSTWYGYNSASGGKITGNLSNVTLNTSYGNGRICITMPGSYTFTWNSSNNQLSISYPTDVYYVRGGWDSWAWSHPMTETSSGVYEATINMTEANHTYTANTEAGFKVLIAGQYYGKNGTTFTRSTSTGSAEVSGCSTDGQNLGLTTDYTGDYTFKYTVSGNKLQITYPTAYKVTYEKGTVNGSTGTCSAKDIDNGNTSVTSNSTWVKSGNKVVLTAPNEKTGYAWKGWYTNAGGTGEISTNKVCTLTVNSAKTAYACYTENQYNETVAISPAGWGTTTPSAGTVAIKQDNGTSITATAGSDYAFVNWTYSGGGIALKSPSTATSNPATFTATTTGGTITANFADKWNVKGDQWDNWNTYNGMPATGTANTFSKSFSLPAKTTYHFKIVKRADAGGSDVWYGVNNGKTLARGSNSVTGLEQNGGENEYITFTTDAAGTYTITYLYDSSVGSMKVTVGYPTAYTVTFGKGTGGATITASATSAGGSFNSGDYVASGDNVTFTQTASSSGYTFSGWYTTKDTGGSAVTGMGVSDNVLENVTANKTVWSRYTANNYTVTFDLTNGGTCGTASKGVTFGSAYGALPTPTPPGEDSFIGWYTTASGSGELVTAATIVSTASNHRLYARYEHTYEVKVQYKCGSDVLSPQTRVDASASSVSPTVTAHEIFGYSFSGWTETGGSYVTFDNASAVSTTITTTGAATIVANYTAVPTVYFKNNLGWENVYVTFDAYFDGSRQNAPGNYDKPYFQMTQIGSSDIFYCAIPSQYSSTWAWNIAFDNTGFDASGNVGKKYGAFDSGEFIGRADFDQKATMFIPFDGDTETRNGGTFYNTGCWIQYNTNYSGYKVRVNSKVQGGGGTETVAELRSTIAGSTEFTATVNLTSANYKYGVMLYKDYQTNTNDIWFTNVNDNDHVITSATTSLPWAFYKCTDSWQRCQVQTEALGVYKFTVSFATGKPMVDIEYPVSVGDWKLIYTDADTWSNDAMHPSRVIKANANAIDTVSFFVSKATGANAAVELHKCTAINPSTGAETWTKQSNVSLTSITATGIYNFKITQNGSKVASAAYDGVYSGNFYIRTDASDGGWSNYKMSGKNLMTYSEYAQEKYDYTHYFMRFAEKGVNIKFIIANDYNECLSDTMISDTYTNEWIEAYANVRFMWDKRTNKVGRAYISGSSIVSDRFLVLEGSSMMYDENGKALTTAGGGKISGLNDNEMKFTDDQNWIYEATIMAKPGAKALLTAKYNGKVQYFGGSGPLVTDSVMLINGSGTDKYKVRVVYDFKTNRLIKAFIPEGAITTNLAIQTDLMIIRDHQADAKQITFSGSGRLSEVKTVYGAMMFNKWTVNDKLRESGHGNAGLSRYERDLFYISFPFDVKLSEVFGFGTYGKHWIIEYYDGKGRAKNGFWADSDPNWKFVMPKERNSFTMKAFEGYILALDLDELTESSEVWYNGVENVYIYFPSSALVENIASTSRSVTIDQTGYQCTINRPTPDGDRRVKDSYWHCIGVPSFANYSSALYDTNGGTLINWSDTKSDGDNDQWTSPNLPYLYEVNWSDKSLSVTSSATFSFKATWSYLVQYEKSSIYWANVNVTPAGIAARHRANWKSNYEFRLELQKDNEKVDQTYVSLRDDEAVTNNFDFNFDLSKEMNASRANIYTMVEGYIQTAGNCLPLETEQVTTVPVGVVAKTDGSYTFAMPDGTEGLNVMLYDNQSNKYIDLSIEDYTLDLTAGTYDNRFYLTIDPRNSASTIDVVSGEGEDVEAAKIFRNGLLYIQRGDKLYDARGARVK